VPNANRGRQTFVISVLLIVAMLVVGLGLWQWRLNRRDVPVIIYVVDTLRADRLGVYGYALPTTPNLDELAAESVVFEQAYAPSPWTLPSVASLITSTFVCEHGLTRGKKQLNASVETLAEKLSKVGFITAGYYNNLLVGSMAALDRGYQDFVFKSWSDDRRAADVAQFLNRAANEPFYLYLHTMEAHTVESVPSGIIRQLGHVSVDDRKKYGETYQRYRELRFADYAANRPVGTTDNSLVQDQTRAELEGMLDSVNILYDSAVLEADGNLGDVVQVLRDRGVWEKSIFVFLSDHGEEFGEHGGWFHDQAVYEEVARVPLMIHFPGDEFAGTRIPNVVSLVDVMPTVFDYIERSELCGECRGESLLPLLRGEAKVENQRKVVPALRVNEQSYYRAWKEQRGDLNVVVRQAQWKAVWNAEPDTLELYDLERDPAEYSDLSDSLPATAQQLRQHAREWLAVCQSWLQAPTELAADELDAETTEKLRALGYFN
jgi:arylsulfatase A-like enzyme